jgi:mono/diheme cytochrome c family protein
MVERGKAVFLGPGLCLACHGQTGKGGVGPDLTDGPWLHHDGSYEALVRQIRQGIDQKTSKGGQIMPPKGGSSISEKDLLAVAAYVWALGRKAAAKP